ncbi:sialate O-acetylesterase [Lentilactobacillus parakefiri]|uniref:Putative deacetylase (Acetyl esterase) n=2 Tax=Lentilactobacillus parakefiri TaxID=152332 RepID=A0A224V7I1_9LACO|nr:sialate O-acetylesterase [Lentilactobacillus parakefiri]KRL52150.1 hypothetical protein FD08_GL000333 [Lentilactobacillus parakefiri DSM 10551]TDG93328.1 hypothetical protein C5L28_001798 [Lentilactobacillus parakefiri]GAW72996.1 putative deacetylase (acetyl esterase) [Lentilactobacillus parakefiri]
METNRKPLTIISAGQSNIDGRVPIAELPKPLSLPLTNCHYCSNYTPNHEAGVFQDSIKVSDLSDNRWGFDLVTHYCLTQLAHYDLYVMKCTEGGTSVAVTGEGGHQGYNHWTTEIDRLKSPSNSLLLQFKQILDACMKNQEQGLDVDAMLWHQGEGDRASFSEEAAYHYYENLKAVFKACRGFVNKPDLPIFCGTVSHNSEQYDAKVEAGLLKIAKEDANVHVIDMQKGTLLDQFHFDPKSSVYFGRAIYNAMIDTHVIDAEKLDIGGYRVY